MKLAHKKNVPPRRNVSDNMICNYFKTVGEGIPDLWLLRVAIAAALPVVALAAVLGGLSATTVVAT